MPFTTESIREVKRHATLDTFDSFRGSLRFVPPELLDGETPTTGNDVYGLATTLWAAATGETPFGAIDDPTSLVMARISRDWEVLSATLVVDGDRVRLAEGLAEAAGDDD